MAQNPYASFNAAADPYTNSSSMNTNPYANAPAAPYGNGAGTGYGGLVGTSATASSNTNVARKPSTDDYDPYSQERYGTPPIVKSSSRQRPPESRQAEPPTSQRPGGYGGFYKQENGSGHIARDARPGSAGREQPYSATRSREDLSLRQRRPSGESKRMRREEAEPLPAPQIPATRDFRRPSNNGGATTGVNAPGTRGVPGSRARNASNNLTSASGNAPYMQAASATEQAAGEGTRQIEG